MARPALPDDLPAEANQAYGCMTILLGVTVLTMVANLILSGNPSGALGLLLTAGAFSGTQALRQRARYGRPLAAVCAIVLIVVQLASLVLIIALASTVGGLAVVLSILLGLVTFGLAGGGLVLMFRPSVSEFLAATPRTPTP
jgi:hypothetical protein